MSYQVVCIHMWWNWYILLRNPSWLMTSLAAVFVKYSQHLLLLLCLHYHSTSSHWRETPPQVAWAGPNCCLVFGLLLYLGTTLCYHEIVIQQTDRQNIQESKYTGTSYFGPDLLIMSQCLILILGVSRLPPRDTLSFDPNTHLQL